MGEHLDPFLSINSTKDKEEIKLMMIENEKRRELVLTRNHSLTHNQTDKTNERILFEGTHLHNHSFQKSSNDTSEFQVRPKEPDRFNQGFL